LKIVPIGLFCMLSAFAQLCPAQSGTSSVPEANPGRLTVSTPTTLIRLDTSRAIYVERSSHKHCPFPILWASSQFPERYGISHQPFEKGNTVGNLRPGSRGPRKYLVVDAGFNHGLTLRSIPWEAFV
jgi:hypothetical protein